MQDPYLVPTGPTRSVVMNGEAIPVSVEAELKVKSPYGEKNFIFAFEPVPTGFRSGWLDLTHENREIKIALRRVMTSVEANIFARVIEGSWPTGFNGQLAARTSSDHKIVALAEFGGDGPVTDNGNMIMVMWINFALLFLLSHMESWWFHSKHGEMMKECKAM